MNNLAYLLEGSADTTFITKAGFGWILAVIGQK